MKDDKIYIDHILQSIDRIEDYLTGKDHQPSPMILWPRTLLSGSWKLLERQLKGYQKI